MNTYTIANRHSGLVLGVFWCSSESAALDMLAQDAGYTDYAALCAVVPSQANELSITEG